MVDSLTLYRTEFKKVKVKSTDGKIYEGEVRLFESEWDSDSGEAEIWFTNKMFKQSDIESIEIIDE